MADRIPQTSASGRYEAARNALAAYDALADTQNGDRDSELLDLALDCVRALEAIVTPPGIGMPELVEEFRQRITEQGSIAVLGQHAAYSRAAHAQVVEGYRLGLADGERYAHERWEPADMPSQESILRYERIEYEDRGDGYIRIPAQTIDKEN